MKIFRSLSSQKMSISLPPKLQVIDVLRGYIVVSLQASRGPTLQKREHLSTLPGVGNTLVPKVPTLSLIEVAKGRKRYEVSPHSLLRFLFLASPVVGTQCLCRPDHAGNRRQLCSAGCLDCDQYRPNRPLRKPRCRPRLRDNRLSSGDRARNDQHM